MWINAAACAGDSISIGCGAVRSCAYRYTLLVVAVPAAPNWTLDLNLAMIRLFGFKTLRDSHAYLVFRCETVARRYAEGAFDPVEASQDFDQSRFAYLRNYGDVAFLSRNALAVAEEIFRLQPK